MCDVRICSCPGRDIRADEGKASETAEESSTNLVRIELPSVAFPNKGKKKRKAPASTSAPLPRTENPSNDDDTVYSVNFEVCNCDTFSFPVFIITFIFRFVEEPNTN